LCSPVKLAAKLSAFLIYSTEVEASSESRAKHCFNY